MDEKIRIQDYTYNLPEERIAKYPLANRDDSKLLVYTNSVNRQFTSAKFTEISSYLPKDALMVFNNTKVVPARLLFKRDTGAVIEIFCLEPDTPSDYQICFAQTEKCRWKVIVGNIKRWKSGKLSLLNGHQATLADQSSQSNLDAQASKAGQSAKSSQANLDAQSNKATQSAQSSQDNLGVQASKDGQSAKNSGSEADNNASNSDCELINAINLKAELIERGENSAIVEFTWSNSLSFSKVMEICGRIPIPPYLKRDTQPIDYVRYQTYYAKKEGSVAAPTAGLHFAEKELNDIDNIGIKRESLCLHVGAGTFLPVKSEFIADHTMHSEPFSVSISFLENVLKYDQKPIIAVGTTSTRCLESLYFLGVQCIEKGAPGLVEQWEPYRESGYEYSLKESILALINYMKDNKIDTLTSRTRIIIVPGYKYRVINYLVTNFHQPQSTLLLLIAAFIGQSWHQLYDYALANDFRFLSYGDSSLLERV